MPETPVHKKKFELTLPVAIVFASVVIAGAIVLTHVNTPSANAGGTSISIRPPSAQDHIVGSPDAKVVIVEYADFECPYCSLIYPTLKSIVASSSGQVAWVYRNFPLDSIHPQARPAAEAAECIAAELGNNAFWQFVDIDFNNQSELGPDFYPKVAAELGANPTTFAQCVANKEYDSRINTDEAEAVANGGQGTPFTIVVGKDGTMVPFSGALPEAEVSAIVQSVLAKQH
ncbi:MAG: DsbA family protein [Patescibacteria group bacterium]|nr:DsbA family protein [Patescibacteria group bacterium]